MGVPRLMLSSTVLHYLILLRQRNVIYEKEEPAVCTLLHLDEIFLFLFSTDSTVVRVTFLPCTPHPPLYSTMIAFYPTGEQTVQHDLKKERASRDSESHIYKCWSQGYKFDFEDR